MISVNGSEVQKSRFPDGSVSLHCTPGESVEIVWQYESDAELFEVVCLAKHFKEKSSAVVTLTMPYIPNARMDRTAPYGTDVFTLKYFADIINSLGFDKVCVLDPHSSVSMALLDRVTLYRPVEELIRKSMEDASFTPTVAFYPDEGAMKRYHGVVKLPYLFGVKNRDWSTGKIQSFDTIGDPALVAGKSVIIIDDIISKGGTCYHSALKLRELGAAHIYIYATHCENTIYDGKVLLDDLVDCVYTTDSILPKPGEKIHVWRFNDD